MPARDALELLDEGVLALRLVQTRHGLQGEDDLPALRQDGDGIGGVLGAEDLAALGALCGRQAASEFGESKLL